MIFDDWVKETLGIEPCEITHITPEEQKEIKFTVSADDLINLWNAGVENGSEKLTALINAERERQEKCDDIHLRTIAELEEENNSLKETIRKGTSCGDWNDDVHTCQMYLKHEQLQECINQLNKAKEIIRKLCDWLSGRSGDDLELLEQAEKFVKGV